MPRIDVAMTDGSGPYLGVWNPDTPPEEGDVIPIVRIQPQYPRQAALDGTEGYVKIEITITEDGSVEAPRVLEARPRRVFDQAARRAVLKWKFKPRVVDGKPVRRQAIQMIEFKLDQS